MLPLGSRIFGSSAEEGSKAYPDYIGSVLTWNQEIKIIESDEQFQLINISHFFRTIY